MKNTKTIIVTIISILTLTITAIFVAFPIVSAHYPPWQVPTWAYISVSPNPIGVGQSALIVMWLNQYPPTASGAYGDRWDGFTVEVTAPDGSQETLGPFTSDPVGSAYTSYIPTQVGTYTFVFHFPGDTVTGEPYPPDWTPFSFGADTINDTYLESTSDPVTLTVQQEPIKEFPEAPLPDYYWTRPINGMNREWYKISGNWLSGANNPDRFNRYSNGPESAHIMWTRPYWDGGIMGGQSGPIGYYTGQSYESFGLTPPIVLNGRLYYNVLTPPRYGWYAIDLYTGEELYFHNTTGPVMGLEGTQQLSGSGFDYSGAITGEALAFGQIYNYESPNQHGGLPYLWSTGAAGSVFGGVAAGATWMLFDAFTGNYICSIENVPSWAAGAAFFSPAVPVYGKDGSILSYYVANLAGFGQPPDYYLQVWNSSQAIHYHEAFQANTYWMWRPYLNYTFDGNYGYTLNVSLPDVPVPPFNPALFFQPNPILAVVEGEYLIGGTSGKHNSTYVEDGTIWALSLEKGHEGELLWMYNYTPPETVIPDVVAGGVFGGGLMSGPVVDTEDGVFLFSQSMTRERWGFDLATGEMLWGPTEPEPQWNFYGMSNAIAYGMLFSYGYGGKLIAYNITTGEVLWEWTSGTVGFETPYENVPLSLGCIADRKIYMYSSEHSPTMPLRRDANIWCIDVDTGDLLWKIHHWGTNPAIADGYIVDLNLFDNQIYCYGKGPSAITVDAPSTAIPLGSSVVVRGMVTDESAGAKRLVQEGKFPNGVPAVADEYEEAWMEYVYMQQICPQDAEGVEVVLTTLDPNGNTYEIGRATSGLSGTYGVAFKPPVPGLYKIIATFEGSNAYYGSYAETYVNVEEAPTAAQSIEPELTTSQPTALEPTTIEATGLAPTETVEAPLITIETTILIAVAVAVVIGIVSYYALKKRQ